MLLIYSDALSFAIVFFNIGMFKLPDDIILPFSDYKSTIPFSKGRLLAGNRDF